MRSFERGQAPPLLAKYGSSIGSEYAERKKANPAYKFGWPQREGQDLLQIARTALLKLTGEHCSYCDGHPMGAHGEAQVDHFKPKGRPEFYSLVAEWDNLYIACMACNKAKREQWDDLLLRPDAPDYDFEHFFEYRFDSGEVHPNPAASPQDQARAIKTIEILALNRPGLCQSRKRMVKLIQAANSDEEREDLGYRYLIPLCLY